MLNRTTGVPSLQHSPIITCALSGIQSRMRGPCSHEYESSSFDMTAIGLFKIVASRLSSILAPNHRTGNRITPAIFTQSIKATIRKQATRQETWLQATKRPTPTLRLKRFFVCFPDNGLNAVWMKSRVEPPFSATASLARSLARCLWVHEQNHTYAV